MIDILNLTFPELERFIVEDLGQPKFRAAQVWQWIWQKHATSFDAMTDVSKQLRAKIMPKAANWHLDDLMATLESYPLKTREHITFEYLLLGGVNDQPEHARELAKLVSRVKGKLNLIAYNPSETQLYKAPTEADILAFEKILWSKGVTAILRKSKGQDIKAACGQLKSDWEREKGDGE